MSNSKLFMQNQLRKWKDAASQLIASEHEEEIVGQAMAVELAPDYYERCRKLAEAQNTTVTAVVHYMLKQQLALQGEDHAFKTTAVQLENNPLLALDALTGRKGKWEPEVVQDEYA